MWLFDTTYIIDLFKHDMKALKKAEDVDKSMASKNISTVTIHEVLRGIYYLYEGKKLGEKLKLYYSVYAFCNFYIMVLHYCTI